MSGPELLTPREAAEFLRCKSTKTLRKRLGVLGVPVLPTGNGYLVPREGLEAAVTAASVVEPVEPTPAPRQAERPRKRAGRVERGFWRPEAGGTVTPPELGGET